MSEMTEEQKKRMLEAKKRHQMNEIKTAMFAVAVSIACGTLLSLAFVTWFHNEVTKNMETPEM